MIDVDELTKNTQLKRTIQQIFYRLPEPEATDFSTHLYASMHGEIYLDVVPKFMLSLLKTLPLMGLNDIVEPLKVVLNDMIETGTTYSEHLDELNKINEQISHIKPRDYGYSRKTKWVIWALEMLADGRPSCVAKALQMSDDPKRESVAQKEKLLKILDEVNK